MNTHKPVTCRSGVLARLLLVALAALSHSAIARGATDDCFWSPLGDGVNFAPFALANFKGNLIAGGVFRTVAGAASARIAQWDGTSWTPLGGGFEAGGTVLAMTMFNNQLIIGGSFLLPGTMNLSSIAQWDGVSYALLGAGTGLAV